MVDSSETLNPTWTFNVGKRSRPTNQRTKHQKTNKKVYFIIANSTTDTLKQQAQESKALLFYLLQREKNYSALGCKPISLADVEVTEPSGGDTGLHWTGTFFRRVDPGRASIQLQLRPDSSQPALRVSSAVATSTKTQLNYRGAQTSNLTLWIQLDG
jgi:hypothetical protein